MKSLTKLWRAFVSSGTPGLNESDLNPATRMGVKLISVLLLGVLGLLFIVYAVRI